MPTVQDVDPHAARELKLYTENEARLYRKRIAPYKRLLSYRWQAGTYDPTRAAVGWRHIVREAAKQYEREHCAPGPSPFTADTIRDVAGQLERQYAEEMRVNGGAA